MSTSRPLHNTPTTPPSSSSIDYLALGNHIFVLCSIGYIIGNFFRSIVGNHINTQLSDAFANSLFFILALLFVIDSILYYACMFDTIFPSNQRSTPSLEEAEEEGEISERARSTSITSITTTITTHEGDFTPLATPTSDDYWTAASDLDQSTASYHLHPDPSTLSPPPPPSSRALLPLTVDGWGELLNILASVIALISSILPFIAVLVWKSSAASDRYIRYQIIADNTSTFIWTIDAIVYFRAWHKSLPLHYPGLTSWWQPRHWYFHANMLNCIASFMYLTSAIYAAVGVRVMDWMMGRGGPGVDHLEQREIRQEQRTLALAGDVLYLVCALMMELAWYSDMKEEKRKQQRRKEERERRRAREEEELMRATVSVIPKVDEEKVELEGGRMASTSTIVLDGGAMTEPMGETGRAEGKGRRGKKEERKPVIVGKGRRRSASNTMSSWNALHRSGTQELEPVETRRTPREERARQRELRREGLMLDVTLPNFTMNH